MERIDTNTDHTFSEKNPVIQFQYLYKYDFPVICEAWFKKYTYEPKTQLTSITGVTQIDADRIQFYRIGESVFSDLHNYERVTINRADKTITSELIRPRPGQNEVLFEKGVLQSAGEGQTLHNHFLICDQGIKSMKVEQFTLNVEKVLKAIKFA
jgi:hypothetical protein